jgi:hypothetical protein
MNIPYLGMIMVRQRHHSNNVNQKKGIERYILFCISSKIYVMCSITMIDLVKKVACS